MGIVTLNRSDKLNAMNRQLSSELHDALEESGSGGVGTAGLLD
ncbi:MAG: hypothetical protein WA709_31110 [Stellaceae bacterium]